MARIVPQGYANIDAYSEADDYQKVMDWLGQIGNVYKDVTQRHEDNISDSQNTIFEMASGGHITSIDMLENMIDEHGALGVDVNKSGNAKLQLKHRAVGALLASEKSQLGIFRDSFDSLYKMEQDNTNILSRNAGKDVWNKEAINNLSTDDVRGLIKDFSNVSGGLGFDMSTGQIDTKYSKVVQNGMNVQQAENYLQFVNNRLQNIKEGKQNSISDAEWDYLMSDPTNENFDTVREDTTRRAEKYFDDATNAYRGYNEFLNKLQFGKVDSLQEIITRGLSDSSAKNEIAEIMDGVGAKVGGTLFQQFMASSPDALTTHAKTIQAKEALNAELWERKGAGETITDEEWASATISQEEHNMSVLSELYNEMIGDVKDKIDENMTLKKQWKKKYNDWSEVPFGVDHQMPQEPVKVTETPAGYSDETGTYDEHGNIIESAAEGYSDETGTYDEYGNPIESADPEDKIVSALPVINVAKDVVDVPLGKGKITQLGNKTNQLKEEVDNFVITEENETRKHKINRRGHSALKNLLPEGQELTGNNLLKLEEQFNTDNDEYKNTVAEIDKILNVFEEVEMWGGNIGGKNKLRDTLKRHAQQGLLPFKIDKNSDYGQKLLPLLEKLKTIRGKWGDGGLFELAQHGGASIYLKEALTAYNITKGSWEDMHDKYQTALGNVKK